jgi:hypothetical protein
MTLEKHPQLIILCFDNQNLLPLQKSIALKILRGKMLDKSHQQAFHVLHIPIRHCNYIDIYVHNIINYQPISFKNISSTILISLAYMVFFLVPK